MTTTTNEVQNNKFGLTLILSSTAKKTITKEEDKIITSGQLMFEGTGMTLEQDSLLGLKDLVIDMPDTSIIHGTTSEYPVDTAYTLTYQSKFDRTGVGIPRTQEFFRYTNYEHSLFMFDIDDGDINDWQGVEHEIKTLEVLYPWLIGKEVLALPSSSNGWFRKDNDEPLKENSATKYHVYYLVNSNLIKDMKQLCKSISWVSGEGFIKLSTSGAKLVRQNFDDSVMSPERMDYTSKIEDTTNEYCFKQPEIYHSHGDWIDTIPEDTDRKQANRLITAAKNDIHLEALAKQRVYCLAQGMTEEQLEQHTLLNDMYGGDGYEVFGADNTVTYGGNKITLEELGELYADGLLDGRALGGSIGPSTVLKDSDSTYGFSLYSFKNHTTYIIKEYADIVINHLERDEYITDYFSNTDLHNLTGLNFINASGNTGKTYSFCNVFTNVWVACPLLNIVDQNTISAKQAGRKLEVNVLDTAASFNVTTYDKLISVVDDHKNYGIAYKDIVLAVDEAHAIFLDGYRSKTMGLIDYCIRNDIFKSVVLLSGTSSSSEYSTGYTFNEIIYFKKDAFEKEAEVLWVDSNNSNNVTRILQHFHHNIAPVMKTKRVGVIVLLNCEKALLALQEVLEIAGHRSLVMKSDAAYREQPEAIELMRTGRLPDGIDILLGTVCIVEGLNIKNEYDEVFAIAVNEFAAHRLEQLINRWRNVKEKAHMLLLKNTVQMKKHENPLGLSQKIIIRDNPYTTATNYVNKLAAIALMRQMQFDMDCDALGVEEATATMTPVLASKGLMCLSNGCVELIPMTLEAQLAHFRTIEERQLHILMVRLGRYGFSVNNGDTQYISEAVKEYVDEGIKVAKDTITRNKWNDLVKLVEQYSGTSGFNWSNVTDVIRTDSEASKYMMETAYAMSLVSNVVNFPVLGKSYGIDEAAKIGAFDQALSEAVKEYNVVKDKGIYANWWDDELLEGDVITADAMVLLVEKYLGFQLAGELHDYNGSVASAGRVLGTYYKFVACGKGRKNRRIIGKIQG